MRAWQLVGEHPVDQVRLGCGGRPECVCIWDEKRSRELSLSGHRGRVLNGIRGHVKTYGALGRSRNT